MLIDKIYSYTWLIPFFQCLSTLFSSLGIFLLTRSSKYIRKFHSKLSIFVLFISMIFSFLLVFAQFQDNNIHFYSFSWININSIQLNLGYQLDSLSLIMLILITTVAFLVMVYSENYMSHDEGYIRFFVYLNLFTISMIGLVLSPNLIQMYFFWELVGTCSYLLIGFWSTRYTAAIACQKSFITNRIGDFGFLLGILGFYWLTQSFDFDIIAERSKQLIEINSNNLLLITIFSILLFLGPIAKSAQLPLHVWLPDAMEGPTPISALIHAATMVAAGIFLTCRLLPLYELSLYVMNFIAIIGILTAFLGATIAIAQKDLKKGLAYSTMSQLGYMMLALGIGSYKAAIFHLITHAYSKALLFLGSGSVIHAMDPLVGFNPNINQQMGNMGGLRKYMPITSFTFLIGTLSLCGIPPFACFWSKDQIISEALEKDLLLGIFSLLTATLTGFYMFRIYFLTFENTFRSKTDFDNKTAEKNYLYPHESGIEIILPLILLTVPTIFIGFIGTPILDNFSKADLLSQFLNLTPSLEVSANPFQTFCKEALLSLTFAITGIFLSALLYGPQITRNCKSSLEPEFEGWNGILFQWLQNWSLRKAYIDILYEATILPYFKVLSRTVAHFDSFLIDQIVNAFGFATLSIGELIRYGEVGRFRIYVVVLLFGILGLLSFQWIL